MSKITSYEFNLNLLSDLDNAFKCKQDWFLIFNIDKCLVIHFCLNSKDFEESERDLGVIFLKNLKWKKLFYAWAKPIKQSL